jgi:hypothetical protein
MGDSRMWEEKNRVTRHETKTQQSLQGLHMRFGQSMSREKGTHIRFDGDGNQLEPEDALAPSRDAHAFYKTQAGRMFHTEGFSDWRTPSIDQEFKAAKIMIANEVRHREFDTLHHIFPRANGFTLISTQTTDKQREKLLEMLGEDPTQTENIHYVLNNLHSALFVGPNRDFRNDDPSAGLDTIHYKIEGEGHSYQKIDPVSAEYQKMYASLQKMKEEGKSIEALSDEDFTTIIMKPLEKAEKFHIILRGRRINQNVAMWKRLRGGIWRKEPIQMSEEEWGKMQIYIDSYSIFSLSQLKRMFPN